MPLITVDSIDDPRIAPFRDLPQKQSGRDRGLFIAEGKLLVQRLLASQYTTDSVLVDARRAPSLVSSVPADVPLYVASRELLEQIVGFNFHQGMLACGRRRASPGLDQVLSRRAGRLTAVVCVEIQDPENLGGILRNCAAFGADVVLVSAGSTDPFSRRVLRVSMGTVLRLPIVQCDDLQSDLQRLRDGWNMQIVAAVLDDDAIPLERFLRPDRVTLLLGNEAHGLGDRWIQICDAAVTIAMRNDTDSLNVAAASGIFLYWLTRSAT